ncbi:MAG: transcriptional repressor [Candidatus Gastranaerophilales bacterium]|nr:transcriptional repressor [Candidatus Gastranaerophilales bacterium]
MKYSKQRELIYEQLKSNPIHPTAEEVYLQLKPHHPNISLATVYRNLNKLAESSIIKKIQGLDASDRFDHNTHEHYHFICEKCRRVYDVNLELLSYINDKVKDRNIKSFDLLLKGICNNCKEK